MNTYVLDFVQHEEKSLFIQTFERSFYFSAGKNFCHRLKLDLRRQVKLYQTRFQNPAFLIFVTVVLGNKRDFYLFTKQMSQVWQILYCV